MACIIRRLRPLQTSLNLLYERMLAAKHAPRGPFRVLECRHGLAEIVECGAVDVDERHRVVP